MNLQPCKIQAKKYLFRQHTKGGLQKEHNTEERIGGNRPDTRPTSANKNEFSATVSMYVVRRRLLHQNLNPFQGSFRLLCANFFVRGNHLYYFSYIATFGLLFLKLLGCLVKTRIRDCSAFAPSVPILLVPRSEDRQSRVPPILSSEQQSREK